jgi:Ion channel
MWFDSFYIAVVTLTSIGYGDPVAERAGNDQHRRHAREHEQAQRDPQLPWRNERHK